MLKRVDNMLAVVSWVAAGALVLMLLIGPRVIAEDKSTSQAGAAPYASGSGPAGKAVFTGNCGSCHALKSAGTSGQVGPSLDKITLRKSDVEAIVRSGRGGMPAFGGRLSDAQISAVAAFVAR